MKRFISIITILSLIGLLSFVSCKKGNKTDNGTKENTAASSSLSGKFTLSLENDAFCSLDFDGAGKVVITCDSVGGEGQKTTGFNTDSETSEGTYDVADGVVTVHYPDVDMGDWDMELKLSDDGNSVTIEDKNATFTKE